jgi:hypothetical protein
MKLYVVFYNRKTDQYGTPSGAIILIGENEDEAKRQANPLLTGGKWISGITEASHVMAMEKDINVVEASGPVLTQK